MRHAQMIPGPLLACLLLSVIGDAQTVSAGISCEEEGLPRVLRIICESEDLRELGPEIDELTVALEGTLTGAERSALIATEYTFLRTRNGCNQSDTDAVLACLQRVLGQRRQGLDAALENPTSIYDEIAAYELVRSPFVVEYASYLDGRRLRVQGCFILDPAPSPELRRTGFIREDCRDPNKASIRVLFDRMDDERPNYFDRKPSSMWWGDLELRDGQPVLLMKLDDL